MKVHHILTLDIQGQYLAIIQSIQFLVCDLDESTIALSLPENDVPIQRVHHFIDNSHPTFAIHTHDGIPRYTAQLHFSSYITTILPVPACSGPMMI